MTDRDSHNLARIADALGELVEIHRARQKALEESVRLQTLQFEANMVFNETVLEVKKLDLEGGDTGGPI